VTEAELVRSAARARDVVESYRQYDLTVSRWQTRLLTSSASIARIAAVAADGRPEAAGVRPEVAGVRLAELAEALRDVARNGLRPERARLDQLSKDLESLVRERVPGYPRPED
jgi:sigma54-dependent transcription regulator